MAYATVQRQGFRWLVILASGGIAGEHKTERQAKAQAFAINARKAQANRKWKARIR